MLLGQKDIDAIMEKLPQSGKPDPKVVARLEALAKKNGFASYGEYANVVANISLVLAGFDPATKKYVGAEAVIKSQIAQVEADKKMSAKDKKEALADLNDELKTPEPPIENKGNIDLIAKYYDKLADPPGAGSAVTAEIDPVNYGSLSGHAAAVMESPLEGKAGIDQACPSTSIYDYALAKRFPFDLRACRHRRRAAA